MTENIIQIGKGVTLMLSLNLGPSPYISFKNRKKQTLSCHVSPSKIYQTDSISSACTKPLQMNIFSLNL